MEKEQKKLRVGWFSFSCCEDSTILFTEILNDHWQEWLPLIDFRHAKVLKAKNILDELDVAFVEGAVASEEQEKKVKEIRKKSKKVVAIGSCAVTGLPSTQRNEFNDELKEEIKFLIEKFHYGKKAKKLSDVITVDESVPGCPMNEQAFIDTVIKMLKEFNIVK